MAFQNYPIYDLKSGQVTAIKCLTNTFYQVRLWNKKTITNLKGRICENVEKT